MQNRNIKKRKEKKKISSTTYTRHRSNVRGRIKVKRKLGASAKLAVLFAVIAVLLISYMALGKRMTILVGFALFFILGMAYVGGFFDGVSLS